MNNLFTVTINDSNGNSITSDSGTGFNISPNNSDIFTITPNSNLPVGIHEADFLIRVPDVPNSPEKIFIAKFEIIPFSSDVPILSNLALSIGNQTVEKR